jgi:hypothetical protein
MAPVDRALISGCFCLNNNKNNLNFFNKFKQVLNLIALFLGFVFFLILKVDNFGFSCNLFSVDGFIQALSNS